MNINKDLVDAVMMLSFITLVLVGTTDFDATVVKDYIMAGLSLVFITSVVLRGLQMRYDAKHPAEEYDY